MALTTQISAYKYAEISTVGQTTGFVAFTPDQIKLDGYIQSLIRQYVVPASILNASTYIAGSPKQIVIPNEGMEELLLHVEAEVEDYLKTVFDDVNNDYEAKIMVTNVKRQSDPVAGVAVEDARSKYVDRIDNFYVDVQIQVFKV